MRLTDAFPMAALLMEDGTATHLGELLAGDDLSTEFQERRQRQHVQTAASSMALAERKRERRAQRRLRERAGG